MGDSKHTPGLIRAVEMGSEGARIFPDVDDKRERMKHIARVDGRDTLTDFANAHRFVKCWNHFDEMRQLLTRITVASRGDATALAECRSDARAILAKIEAVE